MNSVQNQTTPGIQPQQTAQSAKPAPAYSMQQPQIPAYASPQAPMPNYAGVNIQIYNPSVGVPNLNLVQLRIMERFRVMRTHQTTTQTNGDPNLSPKH